jgi:hypothetical protein
MTKATTRLAARRSAKNVSATLEKRALEARVHGDMDTLFRLGGKMSLKYMDELLSLKCAPELLSLFPNAKEVTESFGAYNAVRANLWKRGLSPADSDVLVLVVGDGHTPRTGATFAYRTRWTVASIDPEAKEHAPGGPTKQYGIERLTCWRGKVEDYHISKAFVEWYSPLARWKAVLVVAVHSHASLFDSVKLSFFVAAPLFVVSMPCCVPDDLPTPPNHVYRDLRVASPQNEVHLWWP